MKITCTISTRGRLNSTLPLTLMSIVNQTKIPDELIIFLDDDEFVFLPKYNQIYESIFKLIESKGIKWFCYKGLGGQVKNHQACLELATTELIWRLDDDNFAESNVCEGLFEFFKRDGEKTIGAVGGSVIDPRFNQNIESFRSQNIADIFESHPIQWFKRLPQENITFEAQHLYSTFMYRKEAAKPYYTSLSRIGHREETLFTHEIFRNGYYLIVDRTLVTHHFREEKGGIRSFTDGALWKHDEDFFKSKMKEWGYLDTPFTVVLDNGLGDHWMFKKLLPSLRSKLQPNTKILIGCCYPSVFEGEQQVKTHSIEEVKNKGINIDEFNVYKVAAENKLHIIDAYKKIYQI